MSSSFAWVCWRLTRWNLSLTGGGGGGLVSGESVSGFSVSSIVEVSKRVGVRRDECEDLGRERKTLAFVHWWGLDLVMKAITRRDNQKWVWFLESLCSESLRLFNPT